MLFAIPLLVEMDYVLKLWLRSPPPYTTVFCCLMLSELLIDALTIGHMLAVNASGKIAAYQTVLGAMNALALPLSWIFLKLGNPPAYVGVAALITTSLVLIGRVLFARHQIGMPAWRWLREVFLPCVAAGLGSAGAAAIWQLWMPASLMRLLVAFVASCCMIGLLGWRLALRPQERIFLVLKAAGQFPFLKKR
jgi:hypothetical protein